MSADRDLRVTEERLWAGLRLVAVDVETTVPPEGGALRVVSVGFATCRSGQVRSQWQTLVNPEVAIDARSSAIHGITDDHVVGEPTFARVAPQVASMLTALDGEQLVFCAHNVSFDVSVLRAEMERAGHELPDVPVLDTMGALAGLVDARPADRSLGALLRELGIVHAGPHQALADAVACAEAAIALLARAAQQGYDDLDQLLAEVSRDRRTSSIRANRGAPPDKKPRVERVPRAHLEAHHVVLSPRAGRKILAAWTESVAECAQLRCALLEDRVAEAQRPMAERIGALGDVLEGFVKAKDVAGAATIVGALTPLLAEMPPKKNREGKVGKMGQRNALMDWERQWGKPLAKLGRCGEKDRCPACRREETCALDSWPQTFARLAMGDLASSADGFLHFEGALKGTGMFTTWRREGVDPRVVGEATVVVADHYRAMGRRDVATALVQEAWRCGCRHPDIASDLAGLRGRAGRAADLKKAVAVCDQALKTRKGSTIEAWTRLLARRNQMAGRLARSGVRFSDEVDADGRPIPLRPHTSSEPRRTRPRRFARS